MDISQQFDNIKIQNFNKKIQNEFDYLSESGPTNIFSNISEIDINNRLILLQKILNIPIKEFETIQQKKENMFKEIDKTVYKKQWNKLLSFHKIVKIKEYVINNVNDIDMQNNIIDELTKCITDGLINTKKYVIYDPNEEKILSLSCLEIDNDKKTFKINII